MGVKGDVQVYNNIKFYNTLTVTVVLLVLYDLQFWLGKWDMYNGTP